METELIELEACLRAAKLRMQEGKLELAYENIREAQGWVRVLAKQANANVVRRCGPDSEVD